MNSLPYLACLSRRGVEFSWRIPLHDAKVFNSKKYVWITEHMQTFFLAIKLSSVIAGSCAIKTRKPRQVRKEAAVVILFMCRRVAWLSFFKAPFPHLPYRALSRSCQEIAASTFCRCPWPQNSSSNITKCPPTQSGSPFYSLLGSERNGENHLGSHHGQGPELHK